MSVSGREESERLLTDTNDQLNESTRKATQIEAALTKEKQRAADAEKRAKELEESACKKSLLIYFFVIPVALGGVY